MKLSKSITVVATALVPALLFQSTATAQFGYTLPPDDFTWHWGDIERAAGMEDFSIDGHDGRFNCTLTGRLRPGSRLSRMDMRQMESELQASIEFVRAAANAMYTLEQQRELDWATLACATPTRAEATAEERLERENQAREKMLREVERRRARQQREQADTP